MRAHLVRWCPGVDAGAPLHRREWLGRGAVAPPAPLRRLWRRRHTFLPSRHPAVLTFQHGRPRAGRGLQVAVVTAGTPHKRLRTQRSTYPQGNEGQGKITAGAARKRGSFVSWGCFCVFCSAAHLNSDQTTSTESEVGSSSLFPSKTAQSTHEHQRRSAQLSGPQHTHRQHQSSPRRGAARAGGRKGPPLAHPRLPAKTGADPTAAARRKAGVRRRDPARATGASSRGPNPSRAMGALQRAGGAPHAPMGHCKGPGAPLTRQRRWRTPCMRRTGWPAAS
jgi:hypothetical protein